jgi:purine-binding chemotaxis protein CheW
VSPIELRPAPAEVTALLERRAARLRAPVAVEVEAAEWIAELAVGDQSYALPLAALRATVPLRMVTSVPLAPPHVIGILRYHGQILTALSLASLLGVTGWRSDPAVLVIVDDGAGNQCAVDCEQVPKAAPVVAGVIDAARARARGDGILELRLGERVVHYIEPARLFDRRAANRHGA